MIDQLRSSFSIDPVTFARVDWPAVRTSFTFTHKDAGDNWHCPMVELAWKEFRAVDPSLGDDEFTASNGMHIRVTNHDANLAAEPAAGTSIILNDLRVTHAELESKRDALDIWLRYYVMATDDPADVACMHKQLAHMNDYLAVLAERIGIYQGKKKIRVAE